MSILARKRAQVAQMRQSGEMPIGPILIIALIVLPLVFLLVMYGSQIGTAFQEATNKVSGAENAHTVADPIAPIVGGG